MWLDVNDIVRAERVVMREGVSIEDALIQNTKRSELDNSRYMELYGLIPEDREPYTHVIDASELNVEQVLSEAVRILEGRN